MGTNGSTSPMTAASRSSATARRSGLRSARSRRPVHPAAGSGRALQRRLGAGVLAPGPWLPGLRGHPGARTAGDRGAGGPLLRLRAGDGVGADRDRGCRGPERRDAQPGTRAVHARWRERERRGAARDPGRRHLLDERVELEGRAGGSDLSLELAHYEGRRPPLGSGHRELHRSVRRATLRREHDDLRLVRGGAEALPDREAGNPDDLSAALDDWDLAAFLARNLLVGEEILKRLRSFEASWTHPVAVTPGAHGQRRVERPCRQQSISARW